MDTAEALKRAMQAVREAGIPEELWPTALPLALADLRGGSPSSSASDPPSKRGGTKAKPTKRAARSKPSVKPGDDVVSVFKMAATEGGFLDRVARQTETSAEDLRDVFHVENGELHLKVLSKDLGDNDKAKTKTVTALMAGAVFAGTSVASIPLPDIHQVCKTMRCYSDKHAAEYVRTTPGFGSIGGGRSAALTHKNGWEREFKNAVARVLGKADDTD
jgi:hypothetical protein